MKQDQGGSLNRVKPKCATAARVLPSVAAFSAEDNDSELLSASRPRLLTKGRGRQTLHRLVPDRWRPDPGNSLAKKGRVLLRNFPLINSLRASETSLQYLIGIRALLSIFQNFFLLSVVVVDCFFRISFIFSPLCLRCQKKKKKFQTWTQNA